MPYISVTLGGKKSSGGYIKIDGGSQVKLCEDRLVYVPVGSHNISFSSFSTLGRAWNNFNMKGDDVFARNAVRKELNAIDGHMDEHFYENSMMVLEVISDASGNVLSLPKYRMLELSEEQLEAANKAYEEQCAKQALTAQKAKAALPELLLCLFFGFLGAHKFYRKQIGMGILYLFTLGLFGIGVIVDLIKIIIRISNSKEEN